MHIDVFDRFEWWRRQVQIDCVKDAGPNDLAHGLFIYGLIGQVSEEETQLPLSLGEKTILLIDIQPSDQLPVIIEPAVFNGIRQEIIDVDKPEIAVQRLALQIVRLHQLVLIFERIGIGLQEKDQDIPRRTAAGIQDLLFR